MKRYVKKKVEITDSLTNWIGVSFKTGEIGAILYTGEGYHIICSDTAEFSDESSNKTFGGHDFTCKTKEEVLYKVVNDTHLSVRISDIYCFDSFKELMQWFTDGIKE